MTTQGETGDASTGGTGTTSPETEDSGETEGFEKGPGVYVRASDGMDSNPGTADAPKRTIQAGIDEAVATGLPAVFVAAGLYPVDHDADDSIVLAPGVSVWGGFSAADWAARDPAAHTTEIRDVGVASVGSWADPARAVFVPAGVGVDTTFDGFVVSAGGGEGGVTTLVLDGSPTVSNNILRNLASLDADGTARVVLMRDSDATLLGNVIDVELGHAAVSISGGAPRLEGNTITATDSGAASQCEDNGAPTLVRNRVSVQSNYDVAIDHACAGVLDSNTIDAHDVLGALVLTGHAVVVVGNTIAVEHPALPAWGIRLPAEPVELHNNIVVVESSTGFALDTFFSSGLGSLSHNTFVAPEVAGCENAGCTVWPTLAAYQQAVPGATDNNTQSPTFVNPDAADFRLDGATPCDVTRGGVAQELPVEPLDLDGHDRTKPWSIGAHETDGDCV